MNSFSKLLVGGAMLTIGIGTPNTSFSQSPAKQDEIDSTASALLRSRNITILKTPSRQEVDIAKHGDRLMIIIPSEAFPFMITYSKTTGDFLVSLPSGSAKAHSILGKGGKIISFDGFGEYADVWASYNVAIVSGTSLLQQAILGVIGNTGDIIVRGLSSDEIMEIFNLFLPEAQACTPAFLEIMDVSKGKQPSVQVKQHKGALHGNSNSKEATKRISQAMARKRQPLPHAHGPALTRNRL